MKSIIFALIIGLTSIASAQMVPEDMLAVCFEWQGYKVEDDGYKMFKKSLGGADPDDVDPAYSRRTKSAKAKFERARAKYEKKTGKKFNSNLCNQ